MNEQKKPDSTEPEKSKVSSDKKVPVETGDIATGVKESEVSPSRRRNEATDQQTKTEKLEKNRKEKTEKHKKPAKTPGTIEKIKSIAKKLVITIGIVALVIGLCIVTDCFVDMKVDPSSAIQEKAEENDYTTLINQWNSAVLAADLSRSFELPRDDAGAMVKKINTLFSQTVSPESFKKQNECVLKGNRKIYTPSLEYIKFLKENELQQKVHFTGKDSQDEIIQELKKVTSSEYVDYKMVEKVAYMKSFKLFFEKNKKRFYKDGFSEHIKDFDTYQIAVGRCR